MATMLDVSETPSLDAPMSAPAPAASPSASSSALTRRVDPELDAEIARASSLASARWSDCLECLASSLPIIAANPYLLVLHPPFLYDYLDSLTETLANLSHHTDDLDTVRTLLQQVYNSFIELGKFAKYQPAFFFADRPSMRRFVRLLDQVTHKNSDKALFPNILSLLTPTLARPSFYPTLLELKLLPCLVRFAVDRWTPAPAALATIAAILGEMSNSPMMREAMQREVGWERVCRLAWGTEPGFNRDQQALLQQALRAHADNDEIPSEWISSNAGDGDADADNDIEDEADEDDAAAGGGR